MENPENINKQKGKNHQPFHRSQTAVKNLVQCFSIPLPHLNKHMYVVARHRLG